MSNFPNKIEIGKYFFLFNSGKMLANNSEDFFGDSELAELTFEYPGL
jgi:hypothetical protein